MTILNGKHAKYKRHFFIKYIILQYNQFTIIRNQNIIKNNIALNVFCIEAKHILRNDFFHQLFSKLNRLDWIEFDKILTDKQISN